MHAAATSPPRSRPTAGWSRGRRCSARPAGTRPSMRTLADAGALRRRPLRQHRRAAAHAARSSAGLRQWVLDLGLAEEFPERSSCSRWARSASCIDLSRIGQDDEVTAIFAAGRDALDADRVPAPGRTTSSVGAQERGIPGRRDLLTRGGARRSALPGARLPGRGRAPGARARRDLSRRALPLPRRRRGASRAARRGSASTTRRIYAELNLAVPDASAAKPHAQ